MKYYTMQFGPLTRQLPICPVSDTLSIAGFVLLGDQALTSECAKQLLALAPEYDYLVTAEAKGIPLAHEMARQANLEKYIVARKVAKAYMTGVFEVNVRSITTAKEQTLFLDTADAELLRGKRVLIVDDVISTGESLRALEVLVARAGGNIIGKMAVLAEGDAAAREDLTFLHPLPLFHPDGSVIG